ncbi:MAG: RrF2 family transcriptional regulator [bacterium]
MRLSSRARYGVRAMARLYKDYKGAPISLKEIARQEMIDEAYLAQLLLKLKNSGLIATERGKSGGYVPSKPATEITLMDILNAVEEEIMPLECFVNLAICPLTSSCFTKDFWYNLKLQIEKALSGITLQSIIEKHDAMPATEKGIQKTA